MKLSVTCWDWPACEMVSGSSGSMSRSTSLYSVAPFRTLSSTIATLSLVRLMSASGSSRARSTVTKALPGVNDEALICMDSGVGSSSRLRTTGS
ncbi:MAG: hypothetical protein IPP62_15880 [bacterium]|nr:hypothetical protein [bacterium]